MAHVVVHLDSLDAENMVCVGNVPMQELTAVDNLGIFSY
jgi:hypothetical protein